MSVRRLVQVKTMEQQQAEEAAARREDELASERLRWQLMQVWSLFAIFLSTSYLHCLPATWVLLTTRGLAQSGQRTVQSPHVLLHQFLRRHVALREQEGSVLASKKVSCQDQDPPGRDELRVSFAGGRGRAAGSGAAAVFGRSGEASRRL